MKKCGLMTVQGMPRGRELPIGERVKAPAPVGASCAPIAEPYHVLHRACRAAQVAFMLFSGERGPNGRSTRAGRRPRTPAEGSARRRDRR